MRLGIVEKQKRRKQSTELRNDLDHLNTCDVVINNDAKIRLVSRCYNTASGILSPRFRNKQKGVTCCYPFNTPRIYNMIYNMQRTPRTRPPQSVHPQTKTCLTWMDGRRGSLRAPCRAAASPSSPSCPPGSGCFPGCRRRRRYQCPPRHRHHHWGGASPSGG